MTTRKQKYKPGDRVIPKVGFLKGKIVTVVLDLRPNNIHGVTIVAKDSTHPMFYAYDEVEPA